jgi:hypothetical protein
MVAGRPAFGGDTIAQRLASVLRDEPKLEESAEIHEQEIGHKVFGRGPDYDTNADNVVRVTASQVRKKLEQYFSLEGASEPVVLEIPKGARYWSLMTGSWR